MILEQIIERLVKNAQGNIFSDETRFDSPTLTTLINTARAQTIQAIYFKNKRINPLCYQTHYPQYSADLQEDDPCLIKFKCPSVINLDSNSDGFRFVGQVDGVNAFKRVVSRGQLANYNNHPFMKVRNGKNICALWTSDNQVWEIYNSTLKYLRVEAVFSNPLEIPEFNKDTDEYPISVEMLPMIEDFIFKTVTAIEAQSQPDYVSNSTDTTQQLPNNRRK